MKQIESYKTKNGRKPFNEWISKLPNKTQARIDAYIRRLALGATKRNVKPLGDGVFEIQIDFGPGYRVYFGELKKVIILLLLGGDKGSQKRDIAKAKEYWRSYHEAI